MYLYDEIEHKGRKIPAYVGYRTVDMGMEDGGIRTTSNLQAVVEDGEGIAANDQVTWRGRIYHVHGDPMLRMKHGEPHHWTMEITSIIG